MKVFKNYFKITWAHKTSIILYTIIFIVLMSFFTKTTNESSYKSVDVNIYLEDNADTQLSRALYDYLDKNTNIVKMDKDLVEDKLFYNFISAAIEIPKDFDTTREALYKSAPDDSYATNVENKINIYLSQVDAYEKAGFTEDEAIKNTDDDLDKKVEVNIKSGGAGVKKDTSRYYFNFLNYVLLSQIILIVSTIVKVYKAKPILMRNIVSPLPKTRINLEMMFGHIVVGLAAWILYMALFVIMYRYDFSKTHINLMMLNSFVFTISVVSMAVMIASVIKDFNAIQGVMNVVGLGSSFLCGAFVPQEILGKTALTIGKIFPSYYFIKNNEILAEDPSLSTIIPNMMIVLGFAAAFIIVSAFAKPKANDNIN
ncbi:ABC transporter permease [Peptoniphilus duerdenii]|uniref:ABC transporter permease n=1 Tax=Peptoniphilus duerdenii TaxID=507750 RepID=UPI0023F0223B|nr:ABC transporter permease [Peptoniphilus duerdenii]